jgi:hypothetical protein
MDTNVPEKLALSVFRLEEPCFDPENGDIRFIRNIDPLVRNFTVLHTRRP